MPKTRPQGAGAGLRRTVRLVRALMDGKELDAKAAARLLGVKQPAALQQLKRLQELPGVTVAKVAGRGVWRFTSSPASWGLPSVIAACFGTSIASLFEGSGYSSEFLAVRSRLIKGTARRQDFENIDRKFWFLAQGGEVGIQRDSALLDDLVEALLKERRVKLTYEGFDGTTRSSTVSPLSLVLYQHQLYLVARKHDRSLHPYRLARISTVEEAAGFAYPPTTDYHPSQAFAQSFGVWLQETKVEEIEVRLSSTWRTYARTHRWHSSQSVEDDEGGGVRVTIRCRLCPEVQQWVLSLGEGAEVIRPPRLRDAVAEVVRKLHAKYSPSAPST